MLTATNAEPAMNRVMAAINANFLPIRSDVLPMNGIAAVKPIRYPVMVHDARSSSLAPISRSTRRSGRSVTTTVWSAVAMNTPRQNGISGQ